LKPILCLLISAGLLALTSCADVMPPTPQKIIQTPIGTSSVKIGMTKDQVVDLWGEPDAKRMVEESDKWSGPREEWLYRGRYQGLPVDAGYLSKTKKLYFDGDNLTNITDG